ncbi:hypothetical protein [Nakamurella multipartita]|uniref:hypothetical protein n=1 Tax=Nakamurella multipartita TaxID=53461 RepID=UPI00019E873C|nr:hypothetical protein [Nakamurella multipartita]
MSVASHDAVEDLLQDRRLIAVGFEVRSPFAPDGLAGVVVRLVVDQAVSVGRCTADVPAAPPDGVDHQ